MGSITGLKRGAFTSIDNSGQLRVGAEINPGTAGQALVSGGPDEPARWDTHTGTIQPLTIGTNLSLVSGNPTFDGGTADTLNATDTQLNLAGGDGITITNTGGLNRTITTDNDGITIINTGGQNEVLRVPNDLTISQNGTIIDSFNGSTAKTIDLEGKYIAGDGIDISGHPVPHIEADTDEITISHNVGGAEKLQVLKVPNTLTFTGYDTGVFDGSSTLSINLVDTDNQLNLTGGNGVSVINTAGFNRTIQLDADGSTLSDNVGLGKAGVLKVPNVLTAGTNISFSSGTTYDGSAAITISSTDNDTTYQGGTGISIDTTSNPDTINASNIPNTALQNSTISGVQLGSNLSTLTFYQSDGTFITSYNGAAPPSSVTLPAASSEILKSLSFIDNPSVQNYNRIYNTANDFIFSGGQEGGSDTLEIDFVATSTSGYCEFGFYANSYNPGMIFMVGIAAATGGTSPFSTTLTSAPVSIDAFKLGLFDGSTNRYSIKEILDFTSYENTFLTSNFFFNNLSVGTRYRMALYGRCYNSGQIVINTGYQGTSGYVNRAAHQPSFMKFYEYDSSIGGARTTGSGGGGGM